MLGVACFRAFTAYCPYLELCKCQYIYHLPIARNIKFLTMIYNPVQSTNAFTSTGMGYLKSGGSVY